MKGETYWRYIIMFYVVFLAYIGWHVIKWIIPN